MVATTLLEGTDGTGAKMSKSRGNYVPLTAPSGRSVRQADVGAGPLDGPVPEGPFGVAGLRARSWRNGALGTARFTRWT